MFSSDTEDLLNFTFFYKLFTYLLKQNICWQLFKYFFKYRRTSGNPSHSRISLLQEFHFSSHDFFFGLYMNMGDDKEFYMWIQKITGDSWNRVNFLHGGRYGVMFWISAKYKLFLWIISSRKIWPRKVGVY